MNLIYEFYQTGARYTTRRNRTDPLVKFPIYVLAVSQQNQIQTFGNLGRQEKSPDPFEHSSFTNEYNHTPKYDLIYELYQMGARYITRRNITDPLVKFSIYVLAVSPQRKIQTFGNLGRQEKSPDPFKHLSFKNEYNHTPKYNLIYEFYQMGARFITRRNRTDPLVKFPMYVWQFQNKVKRRNTITH